MDDEQIVSLFRRRSERALGEARAKYGGYCFRIAENVLGSREDAEECVNDALHLAWRKIPPLVPVSLKALLGRLVRGAALDRYRRSTAQKRCGMTVLLDELSECVPSAFDTERLAEQHALSECLNEWLAALTVEDRVLFVRRYYRGEAVKALAREFRCTENQMAQRMYRLRRRLKTYLQQKGITV